MTEILYSHVSAVCRKDPEQAGLLFVRRIIERLCSLSDPKALRSKL